MSKRSFFSLVTGRDSDNEDQEYNKRYKEILAAAKTGTVKSAPVELRQEKKNNIKINFEEEPVADMEEQPVEEGQLTIDVYQTPEEMVIKSTIAGVKSEDLDITIATDMVTIQGSRKKDENVSPEDYYYQELYWGPFSRSVILPQEIDTEGAKAAMKDGVLTIRLPKFERGKTKKLRINSI